MAKLKSDPITEADIIEYLDEESDFGFELRILNQLNEQGVDCQHGGTYDDPVTKKKREFDIRGKVSSDDNMLIARLAVECKNLRPNFPLVVQCVPRSESEAFHETIYSRPEASRSEFECVLTQSYREHEAFYRQGELVGKSLQQIGRTPRDELTANDSDVYDKWSQAISSSHGLLESACDDGLPFAMGAQIAILPILVVRNGMLWEARYDLSGEKVGRPKQVDRISYFIDTHIQPVSPIGEAPLVISHLEIVTEAGLKQLTSWLQENLLLLFPVAKK